MIWRQGSVQFNESSVRLSISATNLAPKCSGFHCYFTMPSTEKRDKKQNSWKIKNKVIGWQTVKNSQADSWGFDISGLWSTGLPRTIAHEAIVGFLQPITRGLWNCHNRIKRQFPLSKTNKSSLIYLACNSKYSTRTHVRYTLTLMILNGRLRLPCGKIIPHSAKYI